MDPETTSPITTQRNRGGGWITFPFVIVALSLAGGGWTSNLIVYLIQEFRINSIDAAQISNLVNGSTSFIPVIAAIVADSFLGCYTVVWISSLISFLGITLLFLTSAVHSLRPPPCGFDESSSCQSPTKLQFTALYTGIILASLGIGGLRSTITTMGADQFSKPKDQGVYFNWYYVATYVVAVISSTAMVYIEDNISWKLGFGLSVAANLLGLVIFLLGSRFYYLAKPEQNPYKGIARVIVATFRKWKVPLSCKSEDYYYGHDAEVNTNELAAIPTKSFRFLNRAALKTDDQTNSKANPWKTCTVQQVEQLKNLIKIFPLWSSSIFLATPIGIQSSLAILQSLTMDRRIGPHFNIPAASILVFVLISTALFLIIWDRLLMPACQRLLNLSLTPLQRIGTGHVLTVISIGISALVEKKRLNIAKSNRDLKVVPMSVLWLVPQLSVMGIGEAFHFPGQVDLYYQEFPVSLKSLSTAMIHLIIAIAFYLSTALIDLVRNATNWLPNNINNGRLDNVYWVLVVTGMVNSGYYMVCACLYKYQKAEQVNESVRPASDAEKY
ncbi:hypothetical protein DCAR_0415174 [Daucus carota subsp. sativus]|uniref:Uncharacterized protein n=1 Tax=Daucus carota subsp. sativus TaxID=79200 RepID=A0AAF0WXK1_DAUCS|nr:hypothetical protein DCAR_0415174 [Daucus carota subsp. sativus]